MANQLDIKKLLGCEDTTNIDKYMIRLSNLKTDPSNLKEKKD